MTYNGSANGGKQAYVMGGESAATPSTCMHRNNPNGHSKQCTCGWWAASRPAQTVPYAEHPLEDCAADCHECRDQWWWWQERANKSRERNR